VKAAEAAIKPVGICCHDEWTCMNSLRWCTPAGLVKYCNYAWPIKSKSTPLSHKHACCHNCCMTLWRWDLILSNCVSLFYMHWAFQHINEGQWKPFDYWSFPCLRTEAENSHRVTYTPGFNEWTWFTKFNMFLDQHSNQPIRFEGQVYSLHQV